MGYSYGDLEGKTCRCWFHCNMVRNNRNRNRRFRFIHSFVFDINKVCEMWMWNVNVKWGRWDNIKALHMCCCCFQAKIAKYVSRDIPSSRVCFLLVTGYSRFVFIFCCIQFYWIYFLLYTILLDRIYCCISRKKCTLHSSLSLSLSLTSERFDFYLIIF